ncbi:Histidine kinase [Forsythia ovata]|uniref:Histidine kinase n=1 Tax=Forsythia ovata TaxID=205694 RepID=A0ABD1PHH1_9LAMI
MTWFVVSQELQAHVIRPDVQTTEISIAFTLQETADGELVPILNQQPVFAFLPLRTYGLKFILQGDFILPSSREEVDGNSPWNQWLLSEFPGLFVGAERSFCDLPCFRGSPGKAVAAFLSFIPLVGEVHGFFSSLPRMILSKLRLSNCLLLEGDEKEWVPPCKVLRNWTDQARSLLPDSLLRKHLGLGYLNKDIVLSDTLAVALGVDDYGPKIVLQVIISLCCSKNGLNSMGFGWLSSCLSAIYVMSSHSSGQTPSSRRPGSDITYDLRKTPFIPLSDGKYGSVEEGTIWLHSDVVGLGINDESVFKVFPKLYDRLRIVSPNLFSAAASVENSSSDASIVENVTRLLYRVGVQRLSDHEIVKVHILPAVFGDRSGLGQEELMTEYLSFVMFHLQSGCTTCSSERGDIISDLRDKALILTNYGYKRLSEVPIHFSRNFGNPVDVNKLISSLDVKWHEIDTTYLKHPITELVSDGMLKWRNFFQEIGATDFVKIVQVEKCIADMSHDSMKNTMWNGDMFSASSVAKNWESEELFHLLSNLSLRGNQEKFLHNVPWIVSSIDNELHYPKDLFHDCAAVNSVLGVSAPYAIPKVRSRKLVDDIGLKTQVTLDDALSILKVWRRSEISFKASVSQMSDFYTFIWKEMATSKQKIMEELHSGLFIFVPFASGYSREDAIPGAFLSPQEVYWYDSTGSMDQMKLIDHDCVSDIASSLRKMLCNFYPNLHDFFVNECGVDEIPPLCSYLQILLQLSTIALPNQAAKTVFQVFLQWGEAIKSGSMSSEDVEYLQESLLKKEYAVLPTRQDKWVSLHPSFGLVCWCDDDDLGREFKYLEGIPALSKVVTREAIYYGPADCSFIFSLVNWALPYAQRYILNAHPDKYFQLKQSNFEDLRHLQIIVVEKLFYRNVIKREITSKKRYECSCLLQDNILYCSRESDSHSIFMELSRLLYNGTPELHFANFLHMITTMTESGSTEEQIEFFILNSQKVPKLPLDESDWSLSHVSSSVENNATELENFVSKKTEEQNSTVFKRRPGINSNWPPADWKTAPGFNSASAFGFNTLAGSGLQTTKWDSGKENLEQRVVEVSSELIIDGNPIVITPTASLNAEVSGSQSNHASNTIDSDMNVALDSVDLVDSMNFGSPNSVERDHLSIDTTNAQQALFTGRLGEFVAFKYFNGKVGGMFVKWVNEANESGLPYDIIIGGDENSREYIEVKATKSARKNWFVISMREWQFAVEKGESFSIAHVILSGNEMAKITIYKNPARLCKLGNLKLAMLVPK